MKFKRAQRDNKRILGKLCMNKMRSLIKKQNHKNKQPKRNLGAEEYNDRTEKKNQQRTSIRLDYAEGRELQQQTVMQKNQ